MRAIFAFLFLIVLAAAPIQAQQGDLMAASGGEHLWMVRPSSKATERFDLLHHALDMGGPYAAATIQIFTKPDAIAANGDRVWIASRPEDGWRSVYSLRIRKRPELELYVHEPATRFAVVDPLPGDGDLVGFTATINGPVALIRSGDVYRLLELRGDRWVTSPLPDSIVGDVAVLGVDGPDHARLNLLISAPRRPTHTLLFRRSADGWMADPALLEIDLRLVQSVTSVRNRLAAVIHHRSEQAGTTPRVIGSVHSLLELVYIRPGSVIPLTQFETASRNPVIVGMNNGFRLIEMPPDDKNALTMRTIHWLTGELGAVEPIAPPPLATGRLWHVVIMLTITVVAVLLVLLVRPGTTLAGEPVTKNGSSREATPSHVNRLPKNVVVFPAMLRMIALLIDLAPGGVLAVLIVHVPPIELLRLPIMTHSVDQAAPYLVMIGVMFVHVTLSEMVKSTSLGKALMGGRVMSEDGGKASLKQVLVRNSLKMLILMVPPLAIFALLSRHLQGFNDILAGTVVVGDLVESEDGEDTGVDQ